MAGILRVFEVGSGRTDETVDTRLGVEPNEDDVLESREGGAGVTGRAGGGISAESDFAETLTRDVVNRCTLLRLGNAGGMSTSTSVPSSIASCVSSGVEIVTDTGSAGEMGYDKVGGKISGILGDVSQGLVPISSLVAALPSHQARRYEVINY